MKFLRPRRPDDVTSRAEREAAARQTEDLARRISAVLPALIEHRQNNHFADRLRAAYGEAPR